MNKLVIQLPLVSETASELNHTVINSTSFNIKRETGELKKKPSSSQTHTREQFCLEISKQTSPSATHRPHNVPL